MSNPYESRRIPSAEFSRPRDRFLAFPQLQPKTEGADYVESKGLLVPSRFAGLDQALSSGRPFIIRSEHPQDYTGVSGLLESIPITTKRVEKAKERAGGVPDRVVWRPNTEVLPGHHLTQILARIEVADQAEVEKNLKILSQPHLKTYIDLTGEDFRSFFDGISYSYWEHIDGINRSIIADNAVDGRYHIFSKNVDANGYVQGRSYMRVEGNEIRTSISANTFLDPSSPQELVAFYQQVRELDAFDKDHCPVLEVQTAQTGETYFLQYHRTRDLAPATHALGRERAADEIEATFVRGATPPEGLTTDVNIYYGRSKRHLTDETGGMEFGSSGIHTELMARRRNLQVVTGPSNYEFSMQLDGRHAAVSQMFKPAVSVAVDYQGRDFLTEGVEPSPDTQLGQISVQVVSDGRKAYLKRIA